MCCGQKRAEYRNSSTTPSYQSQTMNRPAPVASPQALVRVRYLESSPIRVRGPATGQQYEFSGSRPVQSIDARDAAPLLQSRFFRRC
jgi:hypothetical protein